MTPSPPIALDGLEFEQRLGSGRFGEVWLALDREGDRRVTVRFVGPEFGSALLKRLDEQAEIARRLKHPALLMVHEHGRRDGWFWQVSEYLPGGSLEERLDQGAMAQDEAVAIIRALAAALSRVHAAGFVVRYLDPGKVLFSERDRAVLSEFGFLVTSDEGRLALPAPDSDYRSPEQAAGQAPDRRSDLYSLGRLFYRMLTGELPDARHRLPRALRHYQIVVDRLLAEDPARRFADGEQVLTALGFRGGQTAESASAPATEKPRLPFGATWSGVLTVIAVLLALALAWALSSGGLSS